MQALKMNIGGIKCDNKECDFNDMTVLFEDYANWLNKPCPKCGSNLLTQKDYDCTKLLFQMGNYLIDTLPEVPDDEQLFKVRANFHGTGEVTFSEIEPIEKDSPPCPYKEKGLILNCAECLEEDWMLLAKVEGCLRKGE